MNQVQKVEQDHNNTTLQPVAATPMEMIGQAIANGGGVDMVAKLMDLQERWEANQGRKAFDEAISAAKAEIGPIQKNREGHNSRYADFSAIAKVVDPVLAKYGLSYRFRTAQENTIQVTCILSHRDGHSEESTLRGPEDKTGNKNAIQAIGSTLTYLQRYTLVQALGLAVAEDDDGKAAGGDSVTEEQLQQLEDELTGMDVHAFMKFMKVERLADVPSAKFQMAMTAIKQERAKNG